MANATPPLCKECKHYALRNPKDKWMDGDHWCGMGVSLVTGDAQWVPCTVNRTATTAFHNQWTVIDLAGPIDPCGHYAKFFEPREAECA